MSAFSGDLERLKADPQYHAVLDALVRAETSHKPKDVQAVAVAVVALAAKLTLCKFIRTLGHGVYTTKDIACRMTSNR